MLILSVAPASLAQGPHQYDFDIARLPINAALIEFHKQTDPPIGHGLFAARPEDEQLLIGPLKGRYTVEDALTRLLEPVGYTFEWVGADRVEVFARDHAPASASEPAVRGRDEPQRLPGRYARLPGSQIERIVVEAGRLPDLEDRAATTRTFERRQIERSGATTVAELLRYVSQQPYASAPGARASGAQFAELRGLGPDMTLVLINGRRTLPSASSITSNAFDLTTIPITAVERIEILLDSGSAPYGTDAVGGIVNVVLRRDIPHLSADLHYGSAHGGGDQRRASISGGYRRHDANVALVVDYFDLDGLLGAQRSRWADQDFRRFGGADQRSINSAPGNVTSLTPANLPELPARFAAVPAESTSAPATVTDFLQTAGQRNQESLFRYWSLVPEAHRLSVATSGQWQATPSLVASADALQVRRRAAFQFSPPILPGVVVPAGSPFNPFGVPVLANVLLDGLPPQEQNVESTLMRTAAGLRGHGGRWQWDLTALHTDERTSAWLEGAVDFARVMSALGQADPALALNLFQDAGGGSAPALASVLADRKVERLGSRGEQLIASVSGPLPVRLPAGSPTATAGAEWRQEAALFDRSLGAFDRRIGAGFVELTLPVIAQDMHVRAAHALSLTFSGRLDDYSDFGHILAPQYGAIWQLDPAWTVRASVGRSFRPPSLYELFLPQLSVPVQFADPARGGELASFTLLSGGNRELAPTRGTSLSVGFTFDPPQVQDLEIGASYWRVQMTDRVAPLSLAAVLAHEESVPGRIVRAAPSPADLAAGRAGALRTVDISRLNVGALETRGIDVMVKGWTERAFGRLMPSLAATWVEKFETTDLPGMPGVDRVGVADFAGSIPRWRAIAGLDWQRGVAAASISARYHPAYEDAIAGSRTGRRIGSQTIVDLQASIELGAGARTDSVWGGIKLTAGALNLLDTHAPFAESGSAAGFDQSQGDLIGRTIYLRVGKTF